MPAKKQTKIRKKNSIISTKAQNINNIEKY